MSEAVKLVRQISIADPANPEFFIDFETLTPHIHDLHKKQAVTVQSLRKVEEGQLILCLIGLSLIHNLFSAAYAIVIRSSEYELSPPMLNHIVNQVVSGGTEASEEHGPRQKRLGDVRG